MILVLLDSSLLVLEYLQLCIAKKKAEVTSSAIAIHSGAFVSCGASFHIILISITGIVFICFTPGSLFL